MIRKLTLLLVALTVLMAPFAGMVAAYDGDGSMSGAESIDDKTITVTNDTATIYADLTYADNATDYTGDVHVEVFNESGELVDNSTATLADGETESFDWDVDSLDLENGEYDVVISSPTDDTESVESVEIGVTERVSGVGGGSGSGLWVDMIPGGMTGLLVLGFGGVLYMYLKDD